MGAGGGGGGGGIAASTEGNWCAGRAAGGEGGGAGIRSSLACALRVVATFLSPGASEVPPSREELGCALSRRHEESGPVSVGVSIAMLVVWK